MSKCEIFAKLKSIRVSVFSQILRQCLSSEKKIKNLINFSVLQQELQ